MTAQSIFVPASRAFKRKNILFVGILISMIALIVIPLFSSSFASRGLPNENKGKTASSANVVGKLFDTPGKAGLMNISPAFAESIATFAADCTTPKSAFNLGETVCAKTDGVDLGYPGGRWVHWLRQDLSIAHGSNTTTLITANPQFFSFVPDQVGTWKVTIAETGDDSQTPAIFTVSQAPESIATYNSTCTLAKDHFNAGNTVCAKAEASFTGTRYIYWVDDEGTAIQVDAITSTSPSATRVFTETGNFWVYFSDDESLRSKHAFTVSNPSEPEVDISVFKNRISSTDVVAGGFVSYEIVVGNRGPDTASTIELTDVVPTNTTYVTSTQDSGPSFTKTADTPTTTWQIAGLQAGESASFTFVYQVNSGTAVGTVISNTAMVTTTTDETHSPDNSSTATASVVSGTPSGDCVLDCPNDVVTTATTHGVGGGANVTFGLAEGFGPCGAISASPASGSFFPIGDTTVTMSSATGGGGCTFKVTVVDTAAPTISCPSNITVTANAGDSGAFVPNPNGSSSNVGMPTTTGDEPLEVTGSREDGDALTNSYPFGVTNITWIATDPSGRQATCNQTVRVFANQVLTIACPANINQSTDGCDPVAVNVGTATANSGTATILGRRSDNLAYSDNAAFNDPYPIGTTTIEWTATDVDTQSASCVQTVTITSTNAGAAPTLNVPPNITVQTSSCSATLDDELGVATAESSCGTVNITRTGIPQIPCPIPGNPSRTCDSFVFPTGTTVITYTATGPGGTTVGTQLVTVIENPAVPPTITAPNDLTVNTGAGATSCGAVIGDATLGSAVANDNCPGVVVTRTGVPAGNNFPVGTTTITYTATDRNGNTATDTQVVTVVDNTVPVITLNGFSPTMWPPNHKYQTFSLTQFVTGATDNCGGLGVGSVVIQKVTSDETENGNGDGNTLNDIVIASDCKSVQLRAERNGGGNGRMYTITFKVTDTHGNVGYATAQVKVPHNNGGTVVDDGPSYTVTCP